MTLLQHPFWAPLGLCFENGEDAHVVIVSSQDLPERLPLLPNR
jgi:hypothetical protein